MKLLQEYFKLQKEIYEYFGYVEDWVKIPLDDCTDYLWCISGDNEVVFAESEEDFKSGKYYGNEIYRQRFLPKWVYPGSEYTMICVDTHTDGNKFLSVFDNSKQISEEKLGELCEDYELQD